jgi:hypothetical protein
MRCMGSVRIIAASLITVLCVAQGIHAQTKPVLFYGTEHVVVDSNTTEGREYLKRLRAGRPTPLAPAPVVEKGATLGNVEASAQLGHFACGARSDTQLVVCVDSNGLLSYSDSLAALAFAARPTEAFVPSNDLRQYLASLLSHLPGAATRADLHISTTPCADACARQIRLERRS